MSKIWGIDLGGTKAEGVVLESIDNPNPICRTRVDTQASNGYETILKQLQHLVSLMSEQVGERPKAIGIGHPGSIDPKTELLRNSNTQCMNGKPLKKDLEKVLDLRIETANDANCFALAEAKLGAGKGCKVVFGVIMGTGVGGGIVINGEVHNGLQGLGGEWGHTIITDETPQCYCGKKGCIEMVISGPALQEYYKTLSGDALRLAEIVYQAELGKDKAAVATVERLMDYFGKAMSQIVNFLDPDKIVIGGGVSNINQLYTDGLEAAKKHIFHENPRVEVVRHKLGDSAGVFGAAMLVS